MSGTMRIRFGHDMPIAAVEVLSPQLDTVKRFALQPGAKENVDVPSEASFLRIHLPSGRIVTLSHPGNLDYEINLAELEAKTGTEHRAIRLRPELLRTVQTFEKTASVEHPAFEMSDVGMMRTVSEPERRFRFALNEPDKLESGVIIKWNPSLQGFPSSDGREINFVPESREKPYALSLQIDSRTLKVALPGNLDAASVREDSANEGGRVIAVRISTIMNSADTVGSYMARGNYYAAETMASWADQAEHMLEEKYQDPYSATIGAYLLLRLERYDLMRDWSRNLADRFEYLSDGCVIWAWQNIRQHKDYDRAAKYLMEASRRGPPLYTEGLRLLCKGLRGLGESGHAQLEELMRSTGLIVWNSPFSAWVEGTPEPDSVPVTLDIDYMPIA